MMRVIRIVPAAFVLFVATPALAQEWVEYQSQQDLFAVNFPVQPEVREIAYPSEYGVNLPSRVYKSVDGKSHYLVTVVDYSNVQKLHVERLKGCAGYPNTCANPSGNELRGAIDYALWNFLQRGSTFTDYAYYNADRIEGRRLQLTQSGSVADVCRHSSPPEQTLHLRRNRAGRITAAGVVSAIRDVDRQGGEPDPVPANLLEPLSGAPASARTVPARRPGSLTADRSPAAAPPPAPCRRTRLGASPIANRQSSMLTRTARGSRMPRHAREDSHVHA